MELSQKYGPSAPKSYVDAANNPKFQRLYGQPDHWTRGSNHGCPPCPQNEKRQRQTPRPLPHPQRANVRGAGRTGGCRPSAAAGGSGSPAATIGGGTAAGDAAAAAAPATATATAGGSPSTGTGTGPGQSKRAAAAAGSDSDASGPAGGASAAASAAAATDADANASGSPGTAAGTTAGRKRRACRKESAYRRRPCSAAARAWHAHSATSALGPSGTTIGVEFSDYRHAANGLKKLKKIKSY
mmetsp:Transcript_3437/g.6415  ORF Transcript_3437/g.6415 Transcript_3437/m.6415 type:complete len:242 (-) Transcript_3437:115-840(-)